MRNKILIVDKNKKDRDELEQILQKVVEVGGELFFTSSCDEALKIIAHEHPQLVFLDLSLVGKDEEVWVKDDASIVLICPKDDYQERGEDFIVKPFDPDQVLEKCQGVLDLDHLAPQMPPL